MTLPANDETETRFHRPGDKPAPSQAPAQILVIEGAARGVVVDLCGEELKIGRRPENDLILASAAVSKFHARIVRLEGRFAVEDLGSTNGLLVNGVRVNAGIRRVLYHGDSLAVGDHTLLFCQSGTFTDNKTGMSTISIDTKKVREEVEAFFRDLPGPKRLP